MASVSSLDQDMRNLRMSRYTPAAATEVRTWIESTLGEALPPGDLLDALRDGVALCKLANLVLPPPGVKYKSSPMPFIQMENISQFLRACEIPPLQLPAHDRFLTVDLFESKDPAQVLQCLGAFSRQAHAILPTVFRTTIGPKKATAGVASSTSTGERGSEGPRPWQAQRDDLRRAPSPTKIHALSPHNTGASTGSQTAYGDANKSPPGPVSSWSKKSDESSTAPAWNIHQYGYMGGASQGNQGISFGARRQIISNAPSVPSLAEKEKLRKEKAAEEERRQREAEEAERQREHEQRAEEARAREEEDSRWEQETRRVREEERRRVEEQKRQWAEEERRWKDEEEMRRREQVHLDASAKPVPEKPRVSSGSILRGQTLSEYQREQATSLSRAGAAEQASTETPEHARVRELERQLEEARERERRYQAEREEKLRQGMDKPVPPASQADARAQSPPQSDENWTSDERQYLRNEWHNSHEASQDRISANSSRPLPQPSHSPHLPASVQRETQLRTEQPVTSSLAQRPVSPARGHSLHQPIAAASNPYEAQTNPRSSQNRTDLFLAANAAPSSPGPRISASHEAGDTSLEQQRDRDVRTASQQATKAGGWASKSLLEREMERERERQREWEADQQTTRSTPRDTSQGVGAGQSWDVNQYGYMGGDNMNRGSGAGSGINIGAGRRQILGPREMGGAKKSQK